MIERNADIYVVRTLALMNYLVGHGQPCIKVRDDDSNPDYKVFIFRNTHELGRLINEFNKQNK